MIQSDHELVILAQNGDTQAFETLFNRHKQQLLSMLRSRCIREDVAQDILQETFIKSYLNLAMFNPSFSFGQWIFTIARNLFIDHTRRHKEHILSIDYTMELNTPCNAPTPEEKYIAKQSGSNLDILLQKLPDNYRIMAQLRFWNECTYEEISQKLEIPLNTVKTQISRAREKLCKLIEEHECSNNERK